MLKNINNQFLEYRDDIPETILDYKSLRKTIHDFKNDKAIDLLMNFKDVYKYENKDNKEVKEYPRFIPVKNNGNQESAPGIQNIGIFSTALCLEVISSYAKKITNYNSDRVGKKITWEDKPDRRKQSIKVEHEFREKQNKYYGKEKSIEYFNFIINGLNGKFGIKLVILPKIVTLLRFGNYLSQWEIKKDFIKNLDYETKHIFYEICLECIFGFYKKFKIRREDIHPFEIYRFLQFIEVWVDEINTAYNRKWKYTVKFSKGEQLIFHEMHKEIKRYITLNKKDKKTIYNYFFDEIYLYAKYELYRQMSLNYSGDSKLYDVKRLIYALLTVYLDNRFTNSIVKKQALDLIFSPFKKDRNSTWPSGHQVAMNKDGLMVVTDNECVCDILSCEHLNDNLIDYLVELKFIYDGYTRTKKISDKGEIIGWYPVHQRDRQPTSWTTAFTLLFIKKFCKLISHKLSIKAQNKFRSNYRKPNVDWNDILDCTAVKSKIRLMFPDKYDSNDTDNDKIKNCKYRTAILFGPPGTGKTTYGRAIAKHLNLDYLELTPGDFFAGGENSILVTINDIFEHLLHLKNTVVFIDEIDDLVMRRKEKNESQSAIKSYDPRMLYVNSLLPRFQELHDKENILLLMATNNIDQVDEAISRMGRVDLVIPVGALSPHGRLKYLKRIFKSNLSLQTNFNSCNDSKKIYLLKLYLSATEFFQYGMLKHFIDMIINSISKEKDTQQFLKKLEDILKNRDKINKTNTKDLLNIQKMKDFCCCETRPFIKNGDFIDVSELEKYDQLNTIIEDSIKLFYYLNNDNLNDVNAKEISEIVDKYSIEDHIRHDKNVLEQRRDTIYNILTPFYDDIEENLYKGRNDKTCKFYDNIVIINYLQQAKCKIEKIINDRPILPN